MVFEFGYFLIALFLFLIYFIVISIFGFFFFIFIDKDNLRKNITLTIILKCFGIGVPLQLFYSMILIALKIFNFFTAYLPLISFDIIFLICLFTKSDGLIKKINKLNSDLILSYLKRNKGYFLILSIVFLMLFFFQLYFINRFLSFQSSDPYHWIRNVLFLHNNGFVDYLDLKAYPPGFVVFCSTMVSFSNNYYIIYFFFKFLPIFLSGLNLVILFLLIKRFFIKKVNIFFILTIYLSLSYLAFRYTHPIASTLATTLGFFFLLFFEKSTISNLQSNEIKSGRVNKINYIINISFFKGLLFAGIFMAQPLYGIFYMLFYFAYEFYLLLVLIFSLRSEENIHYSKRQLVFKFLVIQLSIIFFFVLLILPYFIHISFYLGYPVYEVIFRYFVPIMHISNPLTSIKILNNWYVFLFVFQSFTDSFVLFFNFITTIISKEFIEVIQFTVIGLGILFSFSKYSKLNKEKNNLIRFSRFTFILTISILPVLYFFRFISVQLFQSIFNFSSVYIFRLFELFAGYWVIFFVFFFNYIVILIKKGYKKYNKDKMPSRRVMKVFKFSQLLSIFLISGFFFITNFNRTTYINYFNDNQTEAVLYAGNYFYENPLDENTTILLENLEFRFLYDLLEHTNLNKEYYNFEFIQTLNYTTFRSYFINYYISYNCKFSLFFIGNLTSSFKTNLSYDFEIMYENQGGYVFVKIIE